MITLKTYIVEAYDRPTHLFVYAEKAASARAMGALALNRQKERHQLAVSVIAETHPVAVAFAKIGLRGYFDTSGDDFNPFMDSEWIIDSPFVPYKTREFKIDTLLD